MQTSASRGADEVPPYEVGCLDIEGESEASGHRHVTGVETRDPDGGSTRWSCAQVIAAIEDGERFVVAEDGRGALTLLEPARCPACPMPTLVTDPAHAQPGACG